MNYQKNRLIYCCEVIFLKILKKINGFFDRMEHDLRLFNFRPSIIIGCVSLALGIFSWIVGGTTDKVTLIYLFPRSAISIGFMYFLWGLSFLFVGFVIGGILFGCEKYKRREALKIVLLISLSYVFTLCVHPLFFRCLSPFIAFLFLLTAAFVCFFTIVASLKLYSLWSLCLMLHLVWLLYNCYVAFAIAIIN